MWGSIGLRFSVTPDSLTFALKVMLAMTLAACCGLVVALENTFDQKAYWTALTVAFVVAPLEGASLQQGVLRMLGTVLGAIFGSFMLKITDATGWIMAIGLFFWVFVFGMIRLAPQFSYAGLVAAFTAAIIMIEFDYDDYTEVAMARIEMTVYGVLIWIGICFFVFPGMCSCVRSHLVRLYAECALPCPLACVLSRVHIREARHQPGHPSKSCSSTKWL
eukprot:TRINITY_DN5004_c0_g1_i3.p1 TRINITY_DN5004_c0_g1~~TRINITY_DN5004_c0_g1_i3.p1  ORF type:complete len:219 (+),score=45.68 TRINITY_DN5004_c0_g1_i3:185-841(+)